MTETAPLTKELIIAMFFTRACDWEEDADSDNGCYENMCVECQREFSGYKRRVVCKVCHDLIEAVNSHVTLLAEREELIGALKRPTPEMWARLQERIRRDKVPAINGPLAEIPFYIIQAGWRDIVTELFDDLLVSSHG